MTRFTPMYHPGDLALLKGKIFQGPWPQVKGFDLVDVTYPVEILDVGYFHDELTFRVKHLTGSKEETVFTHNLKKLSYS